MLTKKQVREIRQEVAESAEHLPLVFNALSDTGRYRIFKMLMQQSGLCVTDIANVFGISVPAASQQLKLMEMSGLIKKDRMGQMICYSIKKEGEVVKSIIKVINNVEIINK